ncbi:coproporphyrinogen III oxidase [Spirochaetota bacterium]|nr:coproporphyrinogen III oxidase [Spirochaetota bacterium]
MVERSEIFIDFEAYIKEMQKKFIGVAEQLEGSTLNRRTWTMQEERGDKHGRGGGTAALVERGQFFERAGVNISSVGGVLSEDLAKVLKVSATKYRACGLSLVYHPRSPAVPSVHFNIRLFELAGGQYWFGGGTDLTPYMPMDEDFKHFHRVLNEAIEKVYPGRYAEFKRNCDTYFYLPHRREMRGIGGVFFDYLKEDKTREYELVVSLGDHFIASWLPLAERRKDIVSDEATKFFQRLRHGRYVEFNLLYDRGTLFGLKTGGRVDAILMSLPHDVLFTNEMPADVAVVAARMAPYYQARNWLL